MTLKELSGEMNRLSSQCKRLLSESGYNGGEAPEHDRKEPDQVFLAAEYMEILNKLEYIAADIDYLTTPVNNEGLLRKGSSGRYSLNGYELPSGSVIEAYIYDSNRGRRKWEITRVEHDGTDYYLTAFKGVKLEGLRARTRGRQ